MTERLITEFKVPFVRLNGEYEIKFIKCTYIEGGKAEIFMDIEQVRCGYLLRRFEECGAGQVTIKSFLSNDPTCLAERFLHRMHTKAQAPGLKSYERGVVSIVPVADTNADENAIYDELKSLQLMQNGLLDMEGDEVCLFYL